MKNLGRYLGCLASVVLSLVSCSHEEHLKTSGVDPTLEVILNKSIVSFDDGFEADTLSFSFASSASGTVSVEVRGGEDYVTYCTEIDRETKEGRIIFTPSGETYFKENADIIISDGKKSVTKKIALLREDFRFADGTISKVFSFLEYERYFEVKISKADENVKAVIPPEGKEWLKVKTTTDIVSGVRETTICILVSENRGDSGRTATIKLEKEGCKHSLSIGISQIGSDMEGSLKRALVSFYDNLSGDNWVRNEGWCSDQPLSEWYGIMASSLVNKECMGEEGEAYFGTDDVWCLDLAANNLRGEIPMEFWKICRCFKIIRISSEYLPTSTVPACVWHPGLYSLDLSLSFMNVPLSPAIVDARNLHHLSLQCCNVTGGIPEEITELRELRTLNLRESNLAGTLPQTIGCLENLQTCLLDINPDLAGTLPWSFYDLRSLVDFNISATGIGGRLSPEISRMKKLESFYITGCEFEGTIPEEFGQMDNLIGYDFDGNYFTSIPEFVRYVGFNCRCCGQYSGKGEWVGSAGFPLGVPFHQRNRDNGRSGNYIVKVPGIIENNDIIVDGKPLKMDGYYVDFSQCDHLPFPVWANVKYGLYSWEKGYVDGMKYPKYPLADDLQYPADEYFFDGKNWRHPKLEYPSREYYFDGKEWVHDVTCPWDTEYIELD